MEITPICGPALHPGRCPFVCILSIGDQLVASDATTLTLTVDGKTQP
jgi:hypothetical protein